MNRLNQFRHLRAGLALAVFAAAAITPSHVAAADAAPAASGSWFVFSPPKAGEVVSPQLRVKLLNFAKAFLMRDKPDVLQKLVSTDNPFYIKPPPPPPVPVATAPTPGNTTPVKPAPPPVLSDVEKLQTIADKLQPTGMLQGAGRLLVTYAGLGGGSIEVGQSFTATIPPDPASLNITITDADDSGCVLKLNNTTLSVPYVSNPSAATHPAAPSTPSQPTP